VQTTPEVAPILTAPQREAEEDARRTRPASVNQLVRRLKDARTKDLALDITARLDWQEQVNGTFLLEVEAHKHRILLMPSHSGDGSYAVGAELVPTFTLQGWLADAPLGWGQEHAERQARQPIETCPLILRADRPTGSAPSIFPTRRPLSAARPPTSWTTGSLIGKRSAGDAWARK